MHELISSLQNARIKNIVKLQEKSQERKKQQLFVVEGKKEIEKLLLAGLKIDSAFTCPEIQGFEIPQGSFPVYHVTPEVFSKIAYREDSGGVVMLAHLPEWSLSKLESKKDPLYIVLEAVEKPGNLGAILRTADAAAVDAVIVCDPKTDILNPNVIRSSLGCVFTVPVVSCRSEEAIAFLRSRKIDVYAAALKDNSTVYTTADYRRGSALVLGTEANGLSDFWIEQADRVVIIPMMGAADSLNVSTSAAILIFEARRQRDQPGS